TMKLVELDALPKVFVKVIGPLVAPAGTTTASWVLEILLKFGVAVPLRETALVPVKFVPVQCNGRSYHSARGREGVDGGRGRRDPREPRRADTVALRRHHLDPAAGGTPT